MQKQFPKVTTILKYAAAAAAGAVTTLLVFLALENPDLPRPLTANLTGMAELAPPDATQITVWDLDRLREGTYLDISPAHPSTESFIEDKMIYLDQTPAVDAYEIEKYLVFHRQGWQPVELATGPMDFQYMELELEDEGYTTRNYRGYTLWTGGVTYAFLPEEGYVIGSQDEATVKAYLNHFHRREDLEPQDRELPLAIVLEQNGRGPGFSAQRGNNNCPITRCQALAITLETYNEEEDVVEASFSMLFRNEESAEKAAWDYNEVANHMERKFKIEVMDLQNNGRLITGEATGKAAFLEALR